ncbi:hypothetical protein VNO78_05061 [Psophocarpus tetragonolobus]|uniref:Integrator complex subunit 3 N-terminal domain-containing protein n=1 Tax=Psophocarpus tetragonolobus TaxID=3891 RepID=A0AAN9XQN8_PSOTE
MDLGKGKGKGAIGSRSRLGFVWMALRLTVAAALEAESAIEASLREAFESLQPSLRPPFSLAIPSPDQYALLNRAILHAVLTEPHFAVTHFKHLHALVTDGYASFVHLILNLVLLLFPKLLPSVKTQLLWATHQTVRLSAIGYDAVLFSLFRHISAADYTEPNLSLCFQLVTLFFEQFHRLLEDAPHLFSFALYTFLRVLADHSRVTLQQLEPLKRLEIHLCVKILREHFHLCFKIGRDIIRLLQDLIHVPEFKAILQDIVYNPSAFNVVGFKFNDVSQIFSTRTSSRYSLLRISPEMETQLRFLLTNIKLGHQKRHQLWFANKFLNEPDKEFLIVDIVRFICCAHHPPNEIIQSDIVPRWALIGWLLTCCRRNHAMANVKLALFYDWLFFDERVDNLMNIEPALLLMVHSVPKYVEITHALLEFLLHLVDNYDVERKTIIVKGVSSAFQLLVRKGVVPSLDILTSCSALNPGLREGLKRLVSGGTAG